MSFKITDSGAGLSVLIADDALTPWASFAGWYSLQKFLPEASVAVSRPRSGVTLYWPNRCGVKMLVWGKTESRLSVCSRAAKLLGQPLLSLPPYTAMVRTLTITERVFDVHPGNSDAWVFVDGVGGSFSGICDAKEDVAAPFVKFRECGGYEAGRWAANETRPAFLFVERLRSGSNVNEAKVFQLWEEMAGAFTAAERPPLYSQWK